MAISGKSAGVQGRCWHLPAGYWECSVLFISGFLGECQTPHWDPRLHGSRSTDRDEWGPTRCLRAGMWLVVGGSGRLRDGLRENPIHRGNLCPHLQQHHELPGEGLLESRVNSTAPILCWTVYWARSLRQLSESQLSIIAVVNHRKGLPAFSVAQKTEDGCRFNSIFLLVVKYILSSPLFNVCECGSMSKLFSSLLFQTTLGGRHYHLTRWRRN